MTEQEILEAETGTHHVYCGWGRVIFANHCGDAETVAAELVHENRGKRDIAVYVANPHVVLSYAPQQLFLDPSDMLRLDLSKADAEPPNYPGLVFRRLESPNDAEIINDLYLKRDMVPTDPLYLWDCRHSKKLLFFVVSDEVTGEVFGTVMGIDHRAVLGDKTQGCSLWCLAVDPLAKRPKVGEYLVRALAHHFRKLGRSHMDLSVIHDNHQAKALYQKLGFEPIQTFSIKNKNAYNEALFIGPEIRHNLNPYARIIVDEARSRGIAVELLDPSEGYFRLTRGGKSVTCRESLCDLTTAIAMSRCQDKYVTSRWLSKDGLKVPDFQLAGTDTENRAFLQKHGTVVVKPTIGEQGKGITVGVRSAAELEAAIQTAWQFSERVLLEQVVEGHDLRIVVINYHVVAAAMRKAAEIIGDGVNTARTLIEKQSRRREAATGGESTIPIDSETEKCLVEQGVQLDSIPAEGQRIAVRKTANLHTGGTLHDVTEILHPRLVDAAVKAAKRLEIPVVGFDFMVQSPDQPDYVIIEANERVGLANHEPQPTAERFIDLLFPLSKVDKAKERLPVL
ncbi:MAG: N-acetylglutaminylglutamine synthetase [Pseudomonadota bacterium]|nr:N-acetylglutaminylglutamine synthetase [Pseudomonadota bacterium]